MNAILYMMHFTFNESSCSMKSKLVCHIYENQNCVKDSQGAYNLKFETRVSWGIPNLDNRIRICQSQCEKCEILSCFWVTIRDLIDQLCYKRCLSSTCISCQHYLEQQLTHVQLILKLQRKSDMIQMSLNNLQFEKSIIPAFKHNILKLLKIIVSFSSQQMLSIKALWLLFIVSFCKPDTISIPQTSCTFIVDSNSGSFTFQMCNTPTTTNNGNWSQCITLCCPGQTSVDPPSLNVLIYCKQRKTITPNINLTTIIVFAVLAIIASIIFICFCGILFKLLKSINKNRIIQENEDNLVIEWQNQQQYLTTDSAQFKWCKKKKDKSRFFMESTCSICLQDSPNAEIYCKHIYHPNCIGLWLKKSNFCPLCHREDIRSIKIYCQQCYSQYIICRRGFLIMNMSSIHKKCLNCTQANKEHSIQMEQIQDMSFPQSQILIFQLSSQHLASPH